MVIHQGDVVWVELPPVRDSGPTGRRPAVILQHDRFNRTAIQTTVIAIVTSQMKLAAVPGNVRLRKGEAGLPKPSVVNVTQIATIDRGRILQRVGTLPRRKLLEVWAGVRLVLDPTPVDLS
jgi:mRNA interferase MazF